MISGKPLYMPLDDDEFVDEIRITTVPRFKTSGLSGDEWRVSAHVQLLCKGRLLHETSFHRVADAARFLPWTLVAFSENGDVEAHMQARRDLEKLCMQPGCSEVAAVELRQVKRGCSRCGHVHKTEERQGLGEYRRRFCARHAHRGDASLDDSDDNYVVIEGVAKPEGGDESPSAFGGEIHL